MKPVHAPSYETRPPLPDLLAMGLDEVERWWPFMLARERLAWFERDARMVNAEALRRLSEIDEHEDNPLSPEEEAGHRAASDPGVTRWVKRLRRVLEDMPPGLFISIGYDRASVHAVVAGRCDHGPETEVGGGLPGTWRSS